MGKYASSRNFGYGKQMEFAAKAALRDYYGQGHYCTVATHTERWSKFAIWAKAQGIRDLSKCDCHDLAHAYAKHVSDLVIKGEIAVSTGQNRISSVNTVFAALRGDGHVNISPLSYTWPRSNIRTQAPASLDKGRVENAIAALREAGLKRAAAVVELANTFGVRREEAVKADLCRWAREADRYGAINVIDGTKGGRDAPRWVAVNEAQRHVLLNALAARPTGSKNLLAKNERYLDVVVLRNSELNRARPLLRKHGIYNYQDSRAAYACKRYEQMTGYLAPAVAGKRLAPKALDRQARKSISAELGHSRIDVLTAYVGSSR